MTTSKFCAVLANLLHFRGCKLQQQLLHPSLELHMYGRTISIGNIDHPHDEARTKLLMFNLIPRL